MQQPSLIQFMLRWLQIKSNQTKPNQICYLSDEPAAQYKNRTSSVCFHQKDFEITAEWHFYVVSHGKALCDGVGGTVKDIALGYSSWQPYNLQITTPLPLCKWCMGIFKIHNFEYVTSLHYKEQCVYCHWNSKASCFGPRPNRLRERDLQLDKYKEEYITPVQDEGAGISQLV